MSWFSCCCSCDVACNDVSPLTTASAVVGSASFSFDLSVYDPFLCNQTANDCIDPGPQQIYEKSCTGSWIDDVIPTVLCGCAGTGGGGGPGGGPTTDPECPPGEICPEPCTSFGAAVNYTQFQFSKRLTWRHRNWEHFRQFAALRIAPGSSGGNKVVVQLYYYYSLVDIWNYTVQTCTRTRDIIRVCGVDAGGNPRSDYTLGAWVEDACADPGVPPLPCVWPNPVPFGTESTTCGANNQPGGCIERTYENRAWQTVICNPATCSYQIVTSTVVRPFSWVYNYGYDDSACTNYAVPITTNCPSYIAPNCNLFRPTQVLTGPPISGLWLNALWQSAELDCHDIRAGTITLNRVWGGGAVSETRTLRAPRTGVCCGSGSDTIPGRTLTIPYTVTVVFA